MLPDVGMIGGGLIGEIERDLEAEALGRLAEAPKSSSVPSPGSTASWPPSALPIAHGLPTSSGPGSSELFLPLRKLVPMGWIGGR